MLSVLQLRVKGAISELELPQCTPRTALAKERPSRKPIFHAVFQAERLHKEHLKPMRRKDKTWVALGTSMQRRK